MTVARGRPIKHPVIMPAAVLQSAWGGDTIVAVKIIVYTLTFGVILVIAGAIAALSLTVAPAAAKSDGWSALAVILSGLAVAGGVVYLAEKLVNLWKGVGKMVLELVVERYKQRQLEAGIKIGEERGREEGLAEGRAAKSREVRDWYERQQAAFRAGIPFDEPPPVYFADSPADGADGG